MVLKKLYVCIASHHFEINCFQNCHLKADVLTTAFNCPYSTAKNALMETKSYCIKNTFSSKEGGIEMLSVLLLAPIQLLQMNAKLTAALLPPCFFLHPIALPLRFIQNPWESREYHLCKIFTGNFSFILCLFSVAATALVFHSWGLTSMQRGRCLPGKVGQNVVLLPAVMLQAVTDLGHRWPRSMGIPWQWSPCFPHLQDLPLFRQTSPWARIFTLFFLGLLLPSETASSFQGPISWH